MIFLLIILYTFFFWELRKREKRTELNSITIRVGLGIVSHDQVPSELSYISNKGSTP